MSAKRTVKKGGRRGRAAVLLWGRSLFAIVLVFAALMLYVWKQIRVDQLAREVTGLERDIEQVVNANKALEVEIAALSGLNRIEKIAREELGMQYPDKFPVVLRLLGPREDGGSWRTAAVCRLDGAVAGVKRILLPSIEAETFDGD